MNHTIDKLDELHAETTQGKWECRRFEGVALVSHSMTIVDWQFCCDIHNAWPVISKELKRLRAFEHAMHSGESSIVGLQAEVDRLRNENKQLRDAMQELLDFSDNLQGTHFARSMHARIDAGTLLNPEAANKN